MKVLFSRFRFLILCGLTAWGLLSNLEVSSAGESRLETKDGFNHLISQTGINQTPLNPVPSNIPQIPPIPSIQNDNNEQQKPEPKPILTEEENRHLLKTLMRNLLDNTASRYPFVVNTTDGLIIKPRNFQPLKFSFYSNLNLDLNKFEINNSSQSQKFDDFLLKSLNISYYPSDRQFYWVLEGNRVVIETEGFHFNVGYQGNVTQQSISQIARVSTVFFGMQSATGLPNNFTDLVGEKNFDNLNIISAAAEFVLPPDASLSNRVNFNVNITRSDGNLERYFIPSYDIRPAVTSAPQGGGSIFENLDATNAPLFLQGFPTVDLKPLLNNNVKFQVGSIVPRENLVALGLHLGDFFTKKDFSFTPNMSSQVGIKTLRLNQTDNNDLVTLLANPFLSQEQRDRHYLNSLMWYNFGQQSPEIFTTRSEPTNENWYRYTLTWSHNRTLLKYDPEKIQMTYVNVFSNPGISITASGWSHTDLKQSANSTLGLALGGVFSLLNPDNLNESLDRAKEKYRSMQPLATLNTQANSQQRRQMNLRLNDTLEYGSSNSNLAQISGSYTFSGNVSPESSLLLQLRSGIYRRSVRFMEQIVEPWTPEVPPVYIDFVRPSDFGPLYFGGMNFPTQLTKIDYPKTINVSFLKVTTTDGKVLLDRTLVLDQNLSTLYTPVPIAGFGKNFDIDFGRIKLTMFRQRKIETTAYTGYLYLPSLEFSLTGSSNNFSYALSTAVWFNLFPDSAPMVDHNMGSASSFATEEKTLGAAFKFSMKYDFNNVFFNDKKEWDMIINNSPFFTATYNTNPNVVEISSLSVGNLFQLVKKDFNIVFYPVFSYYPEILNPGVQSSRLGGTSAFFLLRFSHSTGVNFTGSLSLDNPLSIGGDSFYQLEATYDVINSPSLGLLKLGPYYSNYITATRGFESQVKDINYGLVLRYNDPSSAISVNGRLGKGEHGIRGELNMEIKF